MRKVKQLIFSVKKTKVVISQPRPTFATVFDSISQLIWKLNILSNYIDSANKNNLIPYRQVWGEGGGVTIRSIVLLYYQDKQQNLYIVGYMLPNTKMPRGAINGTLLFHHHFWKRLGPQTGHQPNFLLFTGKGSVIIPNNSWTEGGVKPHLSTSPPGKWAVCATPTGSGTQDPGSGTTCYVTPFPSDEQGGRVRFTLLSPSFPHPTTPPLYREAHCASASVNQDSALQSWVM